MRTAVLFAFSWLPLLLNGQAHFFIPDSSVSGIILQNSKSLEETIPNAVEMLDFSGPGAKLQVKNTTGSEDLTLHFHSGSNAHQVAEFQISALDPQSDNAKPATKTRIKSFITESGLKLYLSKSAVIQAKGEQYRATNQGDVETIRYELTDKDNSPFLRRYNYPAYYASFTFKNNRLIAFSFGFENP